MGWIVLAVALLGVAYAQKRSILLRWERVLMTSLCFVVIGYAIGMLVT